MTRSGLSRVFSPLLDLSKGGSYTLVLPVSPACGVPQSMGYGQLLYERLRRSHELRYGYSGASLSMVRNVYSGH